MQEDPRLTRIDRGTIYAIVPVIKQVHLGTAATITGRIYCSRVHAQGNCSGFCSNCAPYLQSIFKRLEEMKPTNPAAFLTWLCKDEAAKNAENHSETSKQGPERKAGNPAPSTNQNPFQQFANQIGQR